MPKVSDSCGSDLMMIKWNGLHALLRTTPAARIIRRVWIPALVAAAVILAFLVLGPFTEKQTSITVPVSSPEVAMATDAREIISRGRK